MGLEGVSINQLRIAPDKELSGTFANAKFNSGAEFKVVDSLSSGQKVDPDKENESDDRQLNKKYNSSNDSKNVEDESAEQSIKYDLSEESQYKLVLDESLNQIFIVNKNNNEVVQKINPDTLSQFIDYLSEPQGAMINRKF